MNLWIVPASDDASFANIEKSLSAPVDAAILGELGLPSNLFAWGARRGRNTRMVLEEMGHGDIAVFYTKSADHPQKKYNWAGRIVSTRQDQNLSQAIWGNPDFELVYLMDDVWPISLSLEAWAKASGYAVNAPLGLRRVKSDKTKRIISEHGGIEQFCRSLTIGGTPDIDHKPISPDVPPIEPPQSIELPGKSSLMNPVDLTLRIHRFARSRGFTFRIAAVRLLMASLRSKPFTILAGNSGTGKSRLVRLFAEAVGATVKNGQFTMIPVRPDWNDSSELLGFFDLSGDYVPGQLVAPLLLAHQHPDKPFFLCLDEMNLARVEYYFSDFLSIVESRRKEGDRIVTDPVLRKAQLDKLKLDGHSQAVSEAARDLQSSGKALGFPDNLYVVGTVNMDETTQPFSRKVLDRANTLEFNDIDLLQGIDEDLTAPIVDPLNLGQSQFRPEFIMLNDLLPDHRERARSIAKFIEKLNRELAKAGFEVGYRVRDESIAFAVYADEAGLAEEEIHEAIVLQKILPRIQGSSNRVGELLSKLLEELKGESEVPDSGDPDLDSRLSDLRSDSDASAVVRKLAGMLLLFREESFTSFWLA